MVRKMTNKKLPAWFVSNRYSSIRRASLDFILDELALRYGVYHQLMKLGEVSSTDQDDLFSKRPIFEDKPKRQTAITHSEDDQNVTPIATFEVVQMALRLAEVNKDLFTIVKAGIPENNSQYNDQHLWTPLHETDVSDYVYSGSNFYAGICLKLATDNEILDELKRLLPKMRKELDIKSPKRFRIHEKIQNLFDCAVFEYLDLILWAKANETKLTNDDIVIAIKSVSRHIFSPKEISEKVRRNALDAMSIEFIEHLEKELHNPIYAT
jgi:hypothetical protein